MKFSRLQYSLFGEVCKVLQQDNPRTSDKYYLILSALEV